MDHEALHRRAREQGTNLLVYWLARVLLEPFFLIYFRMSRIGREHIPDQGPVIVAANHRSFLDPFVIATMARRPMHYIAKQELFARRWQAWILGALGAFPVDRGASDEQMIGTAKAILARGDIVLIFPEGTRIRPGALGRPKRGVGRLALESGAPVVPVAVIGTEAIRRGYAAAATNDENPDPNGGATFALGHPEKIIDFGYRALKETTDKAKAVIAAWSGGDPSRSYFAGCSDGGREALMEAQRFPDDFDGIIVGSPANAWTHLLSGFIWNEQALLIDPTSYVPPSLLPVLSNAALAQCAGQDGGVSTDPFLNDPRDCQFDPATVQCQAGQDPSTCLTAEQVEAVRKIYAGPHDPQTGSLIFPGYEPGTEANSANWPTWIVGASRAADLSNAMDITTARAQGEAFQMFFGNNFFANFVFQDPNFYFSTFLFPRDVLYAVDGVVAIVQSINPDLLPFGPVPLADQPGTVGGGGVVPEQRHSAASPPELGGHRAGNASLSTGGEPAAPSPPAVRRRRPRVRRMTPNAVVQRARLGEAGVMCCLDHFGSDGPEAFHEGTAIYLNREHPHYRRNSRRRDTQTLHLARLLTQEISLMKEPRSPRQAFERQSKLLRDAFVEDRP